MDITITDLKNTSYKMENVYDVEIFIDVFEKKTGTDFNRVDLYSEEQCLTKSRKYMEEHLTDGIHLTMVIHDHPIRILDTDVLSHNERLHIDIEKMVDIYGKLEDWNTSFITDMSNWFADCTSFNKNINSWDVSSVISMCYMFSNCTIFNQPLYNWDVSSVTNMFGMFFKCSHFNQPLNTWKVSKLAHVGCMIDQCSEFKGPLFRWV